MLTLESSIEMLTGLVSSWSNILNGTYTRDDIRRIIVSTIAIHDDECHPDALGAVSESDHRILSRVTKEYHRLDTAIAALSPSDRTILEQDPAYMSALNMVHELRRPPSATVH